MFGKYSVSLVMEYFMKITALLENTTQNPEMEIEHGLSLYIEAKGKKILFDMGQSDLFAKNAQKLGIDLTEVDFAVLSHGHYDHGGGLETFFKINHTASVYVNPYAFEPHYHGREKYIGLAPGLYEKYKDRFIIAKEENTLGDGMFLYNCKGNPLIYKPRTEGFYVALPKDKNKKTYVTQDFFDNKDEYEYIQDDFRHEQYLEIGDKKKVLISGCSHKGILNLVSWCDVDYIVGGFHYKNLDMTQNDSLIELDKCATNLNKYKTKYYTCHCTGVPQYEYLKEKMGEKLDYLSTGRTIEISLK